MRMQMKLPTNEIVKCLVFQNNLNDFVTSITTNMSAYVQNNWGNMHTDDTMKKLFRNLLIFLREILITIDDSIIRDIFHSLSTTFMP